MNEELYRGDRFSFFLRCAAKGCRKAGEESMAEYEDALRRDVLALSEASK